MTNSNNTPFQIINALNEFESFGLNDTLDDYINSGDYHNELYKRFEQLKTDIYRTFDAQTKKTESEFNDFVRTVTNNSTAENIELFDELAPTIDIYSHDIDKRAYNYLLTYFRNGIRFHIASVIGELIRDNRDKFTAHDTDIFRFFYTEHDKTSNAHLIDVIADTFEHEKRELYYYSSP